jgi:transcriptional regulator with XRE-family HTH domain
MSVHEKIRLVREAKGLTQEQVAEKLEMSPNGYGDIERGDSDIKLSKLEKIAELFGISLSELVDLTEKGIFTVSFAYQRNNKHYQNVYVGSSNSELEKQLLINELKDKELAMKDREIAYLKELLDMHKNSKSDLTE